MAGEAAGEVETSFGFEIVALDPTPQLTQIVRPRIGL